MTPESSQFRYSLTVESQDHAVLFCLHALWQYAERHPTPLTVTNHGASEWRTDEGQVTFRFSNPYHRDDFLGDATRLLAGKWTRLGISDDDPPVN